MKAWWKWQLVAVFGILARAALPEAATATPLATALEVLVLTSGAAAGGLLLAGLLRERRQFDAWMRAHRERIRVLERVAEAPTIEDAQRAIARTQSR